MKFASSGIPISSRFAAGRDGAAFFDADRKLLRANAEFAAVVSANKTTSPGRWLMPVIDRVLAEIPKNVSVFVDFHAEATSEKMTMAHYVDGRVTAIVGTHTHVQTSDARLLPKGTAYITDLGMTGPYISSIGRDLKPVTKKFVTGIPARFEVADGPCVLEGAVIDFDPATKKPSAIEPFRIRE